VATTNARGRAYYEMEGKDGYGMEYLMYGMEQIFHIPYKFHICIF